MLEMIHGTSVSLAVHDGIYAQGWKWSLVLLAQTNTVCLRHACILGWPSR